MDIAAMSMAYSQSQVLQQASLMVTKNAMDLTKTQMQGLMQMLPSSPSFGHSLDIRA